MADVQQNYLPGGLTREQMEQALAMSQGSQPPMVDPVAPQPAAPPPVAPPQETLDPAAGLAPPEPAEPPLQLERELGRPRDNIEAYTDANVADTNAIIANKAEMGDEHGMTPEAHKAQQAIHERSATQNKATADGAREDVEARKAHEAGMQAKVDRLFAEMEANKQPPPESVSAKVMGVIGSILTMAGNKPNVGRGVEMLMGMVGSDKERWVMERNANSQLYQAALAGITSDRAGAVNDQEVAQRMAALELLEINDSLNGAKEAASSDHAKAYIEETQRKLMIGGRNELLATEIEKQKQLDAAAAKRAAAASKSAADQKYIGWPTEALIALRDKGGLERGGLEELDRRLKSRGLEEDVRKKAGEGGADAAGGDTPSGREVVNPKLYQQLSAAEKKAVADTAGSADSLAANINDLLKLRKEHGFYVGVPGTDEYRRAAAINSNIQLALKEAKKLGTLDKGSVEFLESMTGDPNSWSDAPEAKLSEIKKTTLRDADEAAKRAGLSVPKRGGADSQDYSDLGFAEHGAGSGGSAPTQPAREQPPVDPRVAEARELARRAAVRGPGGGI